MLAGLRYTAGRASGGAITQSITTSGECGFLFLLWNLAVLVCVNWIFTQQACGWQHGTLYKLHRLLGVNIT